ncbi:MAG: 2-isopropylmalate synthase [Spirochaetaceae bacterium]|nr:MAG: 2-isopropylmalate synthase [Spirochaetaceae bacterium]
MAKYKPFPTVNLPDRTWPDKTIDHAPMWCSVDLRDGNQALAVPMSIAAKVDMFKLLVEIGFKEIEVGFPAASEIEFGFIRKLVEENLIPDDVYIQVLTQARDPLIEKTFESIKGAKNVIMHLYNSTSTLQRRVTFNLGREEIKAIAVNGAKTCRRLADDIARDFPETHLRFEYSPESFSDTEPEYAVEVCAAVMDAWQPSSNDPMILNLPATVEWTTPNVYADQIEFFCRKIPNRSSAIISVHTHNDRGTGAAATELGLLAGADRVEGTLFGNGERTGNLDLVTVALNLFSHGIEPNLNLSNVPEIRDAYERLTGMTVHERHPYAGDLVFTAFSGSHQDAIKKGMDLRRTEKPDSEIPWAVPYLLIDPQDIGRTYEAIIRINSQSGKGGVAYVLSREFGIDLPKPMHPEFGTIVNAVADKRGRELDKDEIMQIFAETYTHSTKPLSITEITTEAHEDGKHRIECRAHISYEDETMDIRGEGNGPIDALVHAMLGAGLAPFTVTDFKEQAVGTGSETEAIAYLQIRTDDGRTVWGAGRNTDITLAGLKGVVSAYNRAFAHVEEKSASRA